VISREATPGGRHGFALKPRQQPGVNIDRAENSLEMNARVADDATSLAASDREPGTPRMLVRKTRIEQGGGRSGNSSSAPLPEWEFKL
jgi:hypothetical protein